jgi:transcriptional regulator with XRE-family HTH domain
MSFKNCFYNSHVMAGRPPTKDAPPFGQRLAAFRKKRGWVQKELAEQLNTSRMIIDYYERRAVNPSLAFIERAAEVLGVSAAELLGSDVKPAQARPGPVSALSLRFEQVRKLPRKDQDFVIRFLDTVLENAGVSL